MRPLAQAVRLERVRVVDDVERARVGERRAHIPWEREGLSFIPENANAARTYRPSLAREPREPAEPARAHAADRGDAAGPRPGAPPPAARARGPAAAASRGSARRR